MKKTNLFYCIIVFLFFIININVFAQEALKSTEEEYYDFLSLQGLVERPTLGYRTLSDSVWEFTDGEDGQQSDENIWKNNNLGTWFTLWEPDVAADNAFARGLKQGLFAKIYGPEWFNSYNTAAPYGQNDGALWQGKGYNTALTAGLRLEGYGFEVTFKPQVSFSENREFETNPDVYPNPYSYSFKSGTVNQPIDIVRRYGDSSFWNYDWGDSEIRWSWHSLTIGFGTQNPWLGSAYLNPMLGSNNAGGYPKLDIGLRKTEVVIPFIDWNLGEIEGRIWVGMLEASNYFNLKAETDTRMLNALSASFKPSFIPNFIIGANRIYISRWAFHNLRYLERLFSIHQRNGSQEGTGEDEDQKASLFINWEIPSAGFNVYGEFGIDDFPSDKKTNIFHTAIYSIGIKQAIPFRFEKLQNLKSELTFEFNNFEMSQDYQLQFPYMGYYAHGDIPQGYTQKGQILGAGTGYFGNSQFLKYKIIYSKGFTEIILHRYCNNNNSILSQAVTQAANNELYKKWYVNYETYFCYGISSSYFITKSLLVNCSFNYIKIYNRNYQRNNDINNYNYSINIKYEL